MCIRDRHGIHIAAHRDFPSGDVVHDFEDLAVYVAADIDTLAGLYLVAAQEPVSYTHLDVYKRQHIACRSSGNTARHSSGTSRHLVHVATVTAHA